MLNVIYLLWCGILIGVSFIATIVKFSALGMTLPLALSVGKVTFNLQIIIDSMLMVFIGLSILYYHYKNIKLKPIHLGLYSILLTIIVVQKWYMLPTLSNRIDMILDGHILDSSWHHMGYVIMETSKVLLLLTAGLIKIKKPQ